MKAFSLFVALCLLPLCGCEKTKPSEIHGQAFIRMQNGESVKLGLVPIILVDSTNALSFIEKTSAEISTTLRKNHARTSELDLQLNQLNQPRETNLDRDFNQKLDSSIKLRKEIDLAVKNLTDAWNGFSPAQRMEAQKTVLRMKNQQVALSEQMDGVRPKIREERKTILAKIGELKKELDSLAEDRKKISVDHYFENWAAPSRIETISDADGRFHFTTTNPPSNYFIYARSSRKVPPDKEEKYRWLVRVTETEINLNNANLFEDSALVDLRSQ